MSGIYLEVKGVAGENLYGHLYLVYRDDNGDEFVIRGGPYDALSGDPLVMEVGEDMAKSDDYRDINDAASRGSTLLDLDGRDAKDVWEIMKQHASNINAEYFPYTLPPPFGSYIGPVSNSNSAAASVLASVGINVDLVIAASYSTEIYNSFDYGLPGKENLLDVEGTIFGTDSKDYIFGDTERDHIFGRDGNDKLHGEWGDDTLEGDRGEDLLVGGTGEDKVYGGDGNDIIFGGEYFEDGLGFVSDNFKDSLYGGKGDDIYYASYKDEIYDQDNKGVIYFNGIKLEGGSRTTGSADGWYKSDQHYYLFNERTGTLYVTDQVFDPHLDSGNGYQGINLSKTLVIKTINPSGLGIKLVTTPTAVPDPLPQMVGDYYVYPYTSGSDSFTGFDGKDRIADNYEGNGIDIFKGMGGDDKLYILDGGGTVDGGDGDDLLDLGIGGGLIITGAGSDTIDPGEIDGGKKITIVSFEMPSIQNEQDTLYIYSDKTANWFQHGNDLIITDAPAFDDASGSIRIVNQYYNDPTGARWGISRFEYLVNGSSKGYIATPPSSKVSAVDEVYDDINALGSADTDGVIDTSYTTDISSELVSGMSDAITLNLNAGNDAVIDVAGGLSQAYIGGEGNDAYIFNGWSGSDIIDNRASDYQSSQDRLVLGHLGLREVLATAGAVQHTGDDLVFSDGGSQSITVTDFFASDDSGLISQVEFNDGVLSGAALRDVINGVTPLTVATYSDQSLAGGSGDDFLVGDNTTTLLGNGGNDYLAGGRTGSYLSGGDGNDVLIGSDNANWGDTLYGDDGDDEIIGNAGPDTLYGGAGVDSLKGGSGNDWIEGGLGNDWIDAGYGNDTAYGDDGDDFITGSGGLKAIYGGSGNDTISGIYVGSLYGGVGNDTYEWWHGSSSNFIDNAADGALSTDQDILVFKDLNPGDVTFRRDGNDLIIFDADYYSYDVNYENERGRITVSNFFSNTDLDDPSKIDAIHFADSTVWAYADIKAAVLAGSYHDDVIEDFAGMDDVIHGLYGDDTLVSHGGMDSLYGDEGNDVIEVYGNDIAGRYLDGGWGHDYISGGSGADTLIGGSGDDDLWGAAGDDTIDGGEGSDLLWTSAGTDTFLFSAGFGQDWLVLDGVDDQVVLQFDASISKNHVRVFWDGNTPRIEVMGTTDTITLEGYDPESMAVRPVIQFADNSTLDLGQPQTMVDHVVAQAGRPIIFVEGYNFQGVIQAGDLLRNDWDPYFRNGYISAVTAASVGSVQLLYSQQDGLNVILYTGPTTGTAYTDDFGYSWTGLNAADPEVLDFVLTTGQVQMNLVAASNPLLQGTDYDETFYATDNDGLLDYLDNEDTNAPNAGEAAVFTVIDGGGGDDLIYDAAGKDRFLFGMGDGHDEILMINNWGNQVYWGDTLHFKAGVNPEDLRFEVTGDALTIHLEKEGIPTGDTITLPIYYGAWLGALSKFAWITFEDHPEVEWSLLDIEKQRLADSITSGSDLINAIDGTDNVYARAGHDVVNATWDDDLVHGGAGNDTLVGKFGYDILYGDEGNDLLYGESNEDTLIGGTGHDTLDGGGGADVYRYGQGHGSDVIALASDNTGQDRLELVDTPDTWEVVDAEGSASLQVTTAAGFLPEEVWLSRPDANSLQVGFYGSSGTILMTDWLGAPGVPAGTPALSTIVFNDATQWDLTGSIAIADRIILGDGQETYTLDAAWLVANDYHFDPAVTLAATGASMTAATLGWLEWVEAGADSTITYTALDAFGQPVGADRFEYAMTDGVNTVTNAVHVETASGNRSGSDASEIFLIEDDASNIHVSAGKGDDIIVDGVGGSATYDFNPGDGHDTIIINDPSAGRSDTLSIAAKLSDLRLARMGDDLDIYLQDTGVDTGDQVTLKNFFLDEASTTLTALQVAPEYPGGVSSHDLYSLITYYNTQRGSEVGEVLQDTGFSFADTIYAGAGGDVVYGGAGNDTLDGEDGDDVLYAGSGDDSLRGGHDDDYLYGQDNDDYLEGGEGDDLLDGDSGNDYLIGGQGVDTLVGGAGNDLYEYALGVDGTDLIDEAGHTDDTDVLEITGVASREQLWFSQGGDGGDDLIIDFLDANTTDQLIVKDWFSAYADVQQLETIRIHTAAGGYELDNTSGASDPFNQLLQAMAVYSKPADIASIPLNVSEYGNTWQSLGLPQA